MPPGKRIFSKDFPEKNIKSKIIINQLNSDSSLFGGIKRVGHYETKADIAYNDINKTIKS